MRGRFTAAELVDGEPIKRHLEASLLIVEHSCPKEFQRVCGHKRESWRLKFVISHDFQDKV